MKRTIIIAFAAMFLLAGCGKTSAPEPDIPVQAVTMAKNVGNGSLTEVMAAIAKAGYVACDASDNKSTENGAIVENYFSADSKDTLIIYQVCGDGGFIRYDVNRQSVVTTRVVWEKDTPRATYSTSYELKSLYYADGFLVIDRIIPQNPASGDTHDGYIEPVIKIRITPV